jgi:hypothetical protein
MWHEWWDEHRSICIMWLLRVCTSWTHTFTRQIAWWHRIRLINHGWLCLSTHFITRFRCSVSQRVGLRDSFIYTTLKHNFVKCVLTYQLRALYIGWLVVYHCQQHTNVMADSQCPDCQ